MSTSAPLHQLAMVGNYLPFVYLPIHAVCRPYAALSASQSAESCANQSRRLSVGWPDRGI